VGYDFADFNFLLQRSPIPCQTSFTPNCLQILGRILSGNFYSSHAFLLDFSGSLYCSGNFSFYLKIYRPNSSST